MKARFWLFPLFAILLSGCHTYTGPFVQKTDKELAAMEETNLKASKHFHEGSYEQADQIVRMLASEQTVSQPQYWLERISILLMQGKKEEAHNLMMATRDHIEMIFDEQSEKKALSLWHGETNKVFKGDKHEIATLYALLALSFMEKQEWEEALRCVKNGLLADASTEGEIYNSDYALLHYIGIVAARYAGEKTLEEDYLREIKGVLAKRGLPVHDDRSVYAELISEKELPNTFLVLWTGQSPSYMRGGGYGEIRHVIPGENICSMVTFAIDDNDEKPIAMKLGDVNFQATTRGAREIDEVLKDKAAIENAMNVSKNIFFAMGTALYIAGSGVNAYETYNDSSNLGGILFLGSLCCYALGTIPWIVESCIHSEADIRSWHNLPGEFVIVPLRLADKMHFVTVRGYANADNFATKQIPIKGNTKGISISHFALSQKKGDIVRFWLSEKDKHWFRNWGGWGKEDLAPAFVSQKDSQKK